MPKILTISSYILLFNFFCVTTAIANSDVNEKNIIETLDKFHQAAANAKLEEYFDLFADDAVFLGTDGSERWTKSEFRLYVEPLFKKNIGWLYTSQERHITQIDDSDVAFFDEQLNNQTYGDCRGSGVLVKTQHGWKILQYNLSVPVPNPIAAEVVQKIKRYHDKRS